jgi:hypothetical protein
VEYKKEEGKKWTIQKQKRKKSMSSFENNNNINPNGKNKRDCCFVWCCPGRCEWFKSIFVGIVISCSIVALVLSIIAWSQTSFTTSQRAYTTNGMITTSPSNHVMTATIPLLMTLPNNLIEYMGGEYHIDCIGGVPHSVVIQPGILNTKWDGVNTIMTCNNPAPGGAGISFRVTAINGIRIVASRNVVFSN